MGARAITIMIGSILGARQYVMAPNLTKCWDTTKPSVLLNSDNQKDVTTGNQQERLALQESSESICQTRKVKMYSNLMREHERLAEMTSPSNISDRILRGKLKPLPRNLAKCWKTLKPMVLLQRSDNPEDIIGNQQGRFNTPSETANQTLNRVKIQSDLAGNCKMQTEMNCTISNSDNRICRVILNDLCSNTTAWSAIEVNRLPRNLAKCWKTVKHFVLFISKNRSDATIGNQQGNLYDPSETANQTSIWKKIQSELIGNYKKQTEMICSELATMDTVLNLVLHNFPGSRDHLHNPACV